MSQGFNCNPHSWLSKVARCLALVTLGVAMTTTSLAEKLRCLVTHGEPTEIERELLALPEGELAVRALKDGFVIYQTEIAVFVRPKNLYNLAYMDECMNGFATINALVAKGQLKASFESLTPSQRKGVRAIMADSFLLDEAGPLVANDKTEFMVAQKRTITLSNGRKEITVKLPEKSVESGKESFYDEPTKAELEKFKKEDLPKFVKQKYQDRLTFTFAPNQLITQARPMAIAEFTKDLVDVLEQQRKAFVAARAALLGAFGGKEPVAGQNWLTLDDETKRYIEMAAKDNFASLGFGSKEEADQFFFDARVKSSTNNVFVGIGVNKKGTRTRMFAGTDVIRN